MKSKISDSFEQSGITLKQLFVQSISATEDTLKAIDEHAAMGAIGDMNSYLRFKAARALGDAAAGVGQGGSGGEGMGAGLGLGAGIGMGAGLGGMVAQAMQGAMQPQQPAAAAASNPTTKTEVQALLDNLDMRLAGGEITETTYNTLVAKWQKRLQEMD